MRASFLVLGSVLGIFVAAGAAAQDTPEAPPATPSPPEPAPSAEPAPPPPTPPTPPVVVLPETPEAAPVKPPKKDVAPADITLEETPDASLPKKGGKRPKKPHPKAESPAPPPEKEPETKPVQRDEQGSKPSTEKTADGEGEKSKDEKSKKDDGEGVLGPFRIGIILGTGLPSILSFGGMIKLTRYFGAGVNIGLIPAIRLAYYGEADLAYQEYDIYGRIFPFGGALFAGAGVGYAHVAGSFNSPPFNTSAYQSMLPPGVLPNPLYITSEASVRVMVLTPMIGLLHTFGSGFTIGIDAGAQIPIAPSETTFETTLTLPPSTPQAVTNEFERNKQNVRDTLDAVSRTIIPTLNLRIGWLL